MARGCRIIAWPRRSASNVYTGALNDALSQFPGVRVGGLGYSPRQFVRLAARPPDILHIHWLERAFWAPTRRAALMQAAHVAALVLVLRMRGTRVIWTAHDPQPHVSPLNRRLTDRATARAWAGYQKVLLSLIDGVMLLSASHRDAVVARAPRLARVPMVLTRHPHYRGQYPDAIGRDAARAMLGIGGDVPVLAFVGSLRAYKNPEGLMAAFQRLAGDAVLLVAGESETAERARLLRDMAAHDARIHLRDAFVPDEDLQLWLRAADLAVLPYRRVSNSGSAHLALSFDVPVLVPDEPVFHELEQLIGPHWVRRFSGDIAPEVLADAMAWVREPRARRPDLSSLDWTAIAAQTLDFFTWVRARGGENPPPASLRGLL